jgi:hypothetical protein
MRRFREPFKISGFFRSFWGHRIDDALHSIELTIRIILLSHLRHITHAGQLFHHSRHPTHIFHLL